MKKNNHYIPKGLLKRWKINNGTNDGVHYFNVKTKKIEFAKATGKIPYSFASLDNLYVLDADSERKENLEDWLSGLENSISLFIDKVERRQTLDIFKQSKHLTLLTMGLISFEFRSPYLFEKGIEFLKGNPDIMNGFNGKSPFQVILENVVNGTTENANQFHQVEFVVSKSTTPIVLVDRPLILDDKDKFSILPLGPDLVLSFKEAQGTSTIAYNEIGDDVSNKLNEVLIDQARNWIVSKDLGQLKNIKTRDVYNDQVIFQEIKNLISGYEF